MTDKELLELATKDPDDLTNDELVRLFAHVTKKRLRHTTTRINDEVAEALWLFDDGLGPYSRKAMISSLIERKFEALMGGPVDDHFGRKDEEGDDSNGSSESSPANSD